MKKFVLAVMAVAAIGFTASCGNKTQQAEVEVDSVAIVDSLASAAAQTDIDAISALLNGGDATKLGEALAAVKEKIAKLIKENPEVAKEYVAKVQDFLSENSEKIQARLSLVRTRPYRLPSTHSLRLNPTTSSRVS